MADPFDSSRFDALLEHTEALWGSAESSDGRFWWQQAGDLAGVDDFYIRVLDEETSLLIGRRWVFARLDVGFVWARLWREQDDPLYQLAVRVGALSELDDAQHWHT